MASAFPVLNIASWLAGRNLEAPPAMVAEVEQFPKLVPRSIEAPRNHTYGDAPQYGNGHNHKVRHGPAPLPRSVDAPEPNTGPKIQDIKPPAVDFDPTAEKKRDHIES